MKQIFLFLKPRAKRAFTLIELLTVIAIIGILAAILIPVVGKVRQSVNRTQSSSNLRQLSLATLAFASDNRNVFPKADAEGAGTTTWHQKIISYLGQSAGGANRQEAKVFLAANDKLERSPASIAPGANSYAINRRAGVSGPFTISWPAANDSNGSGKAAGQTLRRMSEIANPSQTIMITEREPWATATYF